MTPVFRKGKEKRFQVNTTTIINRRLRLRRLQTKEPKLKEVGDKETVPGDECPAATMCLTVGREQNPGINRPKIGGTTSTASQAFHTGAISDSWLRASLHSPPSLAFSKQQGGRG